MLLGIDTSCDETAVAVLDIGSMLEQGIYKEDMLRADLISSQVSLHKEYGGVVPELAAREHIISLPFLVDKALSQANITYSDLTAVSVTRGPGLNGCLLVGLNFAKSLAFSLGIPLIAAHHIEGHIFASELMPEDVRPEYPLLSLVVSGGHTMIVQIDSFRSYKTLASTRDDAAGEAFDKCATLLGLPYPGGPSLSKKAEKGDASRFRFPIGVRKDEASFSFSGLKTAVQRTVSSLKDSLSDETLVCDLAASVQSAIVQALVEKSISICSQIKPRSFVLTGGVAANCLLRASIKQKVEELGIKFCVPSFHWCTDNGAMMAILGAKIIQHNLSAYKAWCPSGDSLGPNVSINVGAVTRWALATNSSCPKGLLFDNLNKVGDGKNARLLQ